MPFESADGHFSVSVPGGTMEQGSQAGGGPFDGSQIHTFAHVEPNGTRFVIFYGDAAPGYVAATSVDAALDAAEAGNLRATGGKLIAERQLTVAGRAGREQAISNGSASYLFRIVFVGDRLYSISVTGTDVDVQQPDAVLFLNSFQVAP